MNNLLIDSDILIDYLKGEIKAIKFLENAKEHLYISVINVSELYAGIKNNKEQSLIEYFFTAFHITPISAEIAVSAGLIKNKYHKSHGTGLADSIIAATSLHINAKLVTLNKKHFPMLKNLIVPYKK